MSRSATSPTRLGTGPPQTRGSGRPGPTGPLALVALSVALWSTAGSLPPPPLDAAEAQGWLDGIGHTAAALAIGRLFIIVLVVRLWTSVLLVGAARVVPDRELALRVGALAETVGGTVARGWVRGALGVGFATVLLVPPPAGATGTGAGTDQEPTDIPMLERLEDAPPDGPHPHGHGATSTRPPPTERSEAPLLVLVEPEVTTTTTTGSHGSQAPAPGGGPGSRTTVGTDPSTPGRDGDVSAPTSETSPTVTPPRPGGARNEPASGERRSSRPSEEASGPAAPGRPEARPTTLPGSLPGATHDRSGTTGSPSPWTIVAGEHLWHVAEATLAELAPGADVAAVAEYHRRLVELNRPNLPVPGNPDLVFPGNVILRPDPAPSKA